jgi:microcystin-dependent protein
MSHHSLHNISDLRDVVTGNIAPQIAMCQRVLFYSQSIIGDYKYCARTNNHLGWVVCDGSLLDRTEHKGLFEVIGTSFGSTTSANFRVPDFRGRVFGSLNISSNRNNALSVRNRGDVVGEETHTLTIDEMPSHNHNINDPGHTHSYVNNVNEQGVNTLTTQDSAADDADLSQTTGNSTTGITINNRGGDQPHNNMQPTLFAGNIFIFAGVPGELPSST